MNAEEILTEIAKMPEEEAEKLAQKLVPGLQRTRRLFAENEEVYLVANELINHVRKIWS